MHGFNVVGRPLQHGFKAYSGLTVQSEFSSCGDGGWGNVVVRQRLTREGADALYRAAASRAKRGGPARIAFVTSCTGAGVQGPDSSREHNTWSALGIGTQVGVLLPFSRAHELEADYIGIFLAVEAGYDPTESIRLWAQMEQASKGQSQPEFFATHPSHGTRIKQLEKGTEEAMPIYQAKQPAPNGKLPQIR